MVSGFLVGTFVLEKLQSAYGGIWERQTSPMVGFCRIVGIVERVLFIGALQTKQAVFILWWQALKVAGSWQNWRNAEPEKKYASQAFLILTGLSMMYAFTGFKIFECVAAKTWGKPVWMAVAVLGFTAALWMWLWRKEKKTKKTPYST